MARHGGGLAKFLSTKTSSGDSWSASYARQIGFPKAVHVSITPRSIIFHLLSFFRPCNRILCRDSRLPAGLVWFSWLRSHRSTRFRIWGKDRYWPSTLRIQLILALLFLLPLFEFRLDGRFLRLTYRLALE